MLALIISLIMIPCASAASSTATVTTDSARVYQSPTTDSASVSAKKGAMVTVTDYSNGWAAISYKGHKGYMPANTLKLKARVAAYTYKSTPVYKGAAYSSGKIKTLSAGTKLYVVGTSGDFAKIQNKSGSVTGYVASDHLASKAQMEAAYEAYLASGSGSTSTKKDKAVALAISFVGRPYGNHEPSSFNCSSLVKYCFEKYGYSIRGTAAKIATDSSLTKVSSYSSCKRGDILCFDTNGDRTCDHVGIYIGDGYFVEASQNAGKVQINSMSSWYRSHLMWARRV